MGHRETTYEPLSLIVQDDPITCAVYAKKHGLLSTPGWKHLKKYVKTSKRLLRTAKQFKIRQVRKAISMNMAKSPEIMKMPSG